MDSTVESAGGDGALTFELRFPQRRRVAGNDDELRLARSQALEGRFVAESDLARLYNPSRQPRPPAGRASYISS